MSSSSSERASLVESSQRLVCDEDDKNINFRSHKLNTYPTHILVSP